MVVVKDIAQELEPQFLSSFRWGHAGDLGEHVLWRRSPGSLQSFSQVISGSRGGKQELVFVQLLDGELDDRGQLVERRLDLPGIPSLQDVALIVLGVLVLRGQPFLLVGRRAIVKSFLQYFKAAVQCFYFILCIEEQFISFFKLLIGQYLGKASCSDIVLFPVAALVDQKAGGIAIGNLVHEVLREDDRLIIVAEVPRLQCLEHDVVLEEFLGRQIFSLGLQIGQPLPERRPNGVEFSIVERRIAILRLLQKQFIGDLGVVMPHDELSPQIEHGVVPVPFFYRKAKYLPGIGQVEIVVNFSAVIHFEIKLVKVIDLEEIIYSLLAFEIHDLRLFRAVEEMAIINGFTVKKLAESQYLQFYRLVILTVGASLDRKQDMKLGPGLLASLGDQMMPGKMDVIFDIGEDIAYFLRADPAGWIIAMVVVDVHDDAVRFHKVVIASLIVFKANRNIIMRYGLF